MMFEATRTCVKGNSCMKPAILIIDDEEGFRMFINDALEDAGYAVTGAPNGQTGLSLATRYRFDLIIVDIGLPDLPGSQLIARLWYSGNGCPIIAITGQPDGEAGLAVAEAYGAAKVLFKPIRPDEIMDAVKDMLNVAKTAQKVVCSKGFKRKKEIACHDNAD